MKTLVLITLETFSVQVPNKISAPKQQLPKLMEAVTLFHRTQVVEQAVVQVPEALAQAVLEVQAVQAVLVGQVALRLQSVLAQVDVLLVKYPIVLMLLDSVNDVQALKPQVAQVAQVVPVVPVAEAVIVEPPVVAQVVKTMPHRETPSALVTILVAHHLASVVKLLQVLDLPTLILAIKQLFKRVKQIPTQTLRTIVKRLQLITIQPHLHRHLQQVPVVLPHPHPQQVAMHQRQHQHLQLQRRVEHLVSKRLDQRQRQRPMQLQQDHRLR
jgi:hypothetical protein